MPDLSGKTILITGATAGIGLVSAKELKAMGATVVVVGRNEQRTQELVASLNAQGPGKAEYLLADLSSLADVRKLAEQFIAKYPRLDVLLNNAGAMNPKRETTADGYERTFATNHLAYFLLTHLLLPVLKKSAPARIVNVASDAHRQASGLDFDDLMSEKNYSAMGFGPYSASKLANILFTRELARRLEGTGVTANSLHPGFVASNFLAKKGFLGFIKGLAYLFALSVEDGAKTNIYLSSSPEVQGVTGKYFAKCRERTPTRAAQDDAAAKRLWEVSEQLCGLSASRAAA